MVHNVIKIGKKKYKIKIPDSSPEYRVFWENLLQLLPEGSKLNASEIVFPAEKTQSLVEFKKSQKKMFSYDDCFTFFKTIGKQFLSLEKKDITIPFFSMEDFIVVDDTFLFINVEKLIPINEDKHITINAPLDSAQFLSPELQLMDSIPSNIYFSSGL